MALGQPFKKALMGIEFFKEALFLACLEVTVCIWAGFPGGSVVKNLPASAEDTDSIPGLGRSLEIELTAVFLPRESHRQRSMGGYSP